MQDPFSFRLIARDGAARLGEITTPHGRIATPAFMPVGTQAAMKAVQWRDVRESGTEIVLGNTLSPDAAPRGRAYRCSRRAAHVFGLDRSDPDRLGGLSGHVARTAAQRR
jgi:hypothetical protein